MPKFSMLSILGGMLSLAACVSAKPTALTDAGNPRQPATYSGPEGVPYECTGTIVRGRDDTKLVVTGNDLKDESLQIEFRELDDTPLASYKMTALPLQPGADKQPEATTVQKYGGNPWVREFGSVSPDGYSTQHMVLAARREDSSTPSDQNGRSIRFTWASRFLDTKSVDFYLCSIKLQRVQKR